MEYRAGRYMMVGKVECAAVESVEESLSCAASMSGLRR